MRKAKSIAASTNSDKENILLIYDDSLVHRRIGGFLRDAEYQVMTVESGKQALEVFKQDIFACVLFDLAVGSADDIQLLKHIKTVDPNTIIIIIAELDNLKSAADMGLVDADDYLMKPWDTHELIFRMELVLKKRGLKIEEREAQENLIKSNQRLKDHLHKSTEQLIVANKHLKNRQEQLEHQQKALIQLNNELSATNTGLKVMAQNYQQIKEETNKEVARIINAKVLPIIERLGPDNRLSTQKTNLEVLYHLMTSITASLSGEANSFISLSATEMKVATMIKNGMTSRQIAKTMFVSMDTIKTHRRNIRRKLDIHDPHIDLKKVLETRSRRDSL